MSERHLREPRRVKHNHKSLRSVYLKYEKELYVRGKSVRQGSVWAQLDGGGNSVAQGTVSESIKLIVWWGIMTVGSAITDTWRRACVEGLGPTAHA